MRTTVRLDDDLLAAAKRRALESGTTLTAVIEDALRRALAPASGTAGERRPLPSFGGGGLQPGVDLDDTAALVELMESPDRPS